MIDFFITTMGPWGFRALIVWVAALLVFLMGTMIRARPRVFFVALALVFVASFFAQKNLNGWYASIRTDRSDEIKAALADRAPQEGLATTVRYAEDDPEDRVEGGVFRSTPAWRAGGVKLRGGGVATNGVASAYDTPVPEEGEEQLIYMKADQVSLVRKFERSNRLAINTLMLLILLALVWDYASTFNSVWSTRLALPFSSLWIDALSSKSRKVAIYPDVESRWRAEAFLSRAVRKGENVIYFGQEPLWEGKETLPRFSVFGLTLKRLPIFRYGAPGLPTGSECAFDAAWFGRYVVTITNDAPCREMIEDFLDILTERRRSGAFLEHTLVIAWDRDEPLDNDLWVAMTQLAPEANFSLLVWSRENQIEPGSTATSSEAALDPETNLPIKPSLKLPPKPSKKLKFKRGLKLPPTPSSLPQPSATPSPEKAESKPAESPQAAPSAIPSPEKAESKPAESPQAEPNATPSPENTESKPAESPQAEPSATPSPENTESKPAESPQAELRPGLNLPPKLDNLPLKPGLKLPPKLGDFSLKAGLKLPPKPGNLPLKPGLKLPPRPGTSSSSEIESKPAESPQAEVELGTGTSSEIESKPAESPQAEVELGTGTSPQAEVESSANPVLKPGLKLPPKPGNLPLKPGLKLPPKPGNLPLKPGLKLPPKPGTITLKTGTKIRIKTPLKPSSSDSQ